MNWTDTGQVQEDGVSAWFYNLLASDFHSKATFLFDLYIWRRHMYSIYSIDILLQ